MSVWTHSSNNDHKLINFNVPKYLITNFDNLVKFKSVSRTSMLNRLMEDYLRSEHNKMKEDDSFNLLITKLSERNREDIKKQYRKDVMELREDDEPPMIPMSNDYDNWEDRFDKF